MIFESDNNEVRSTSFRSPLPGERVRVRGCFVATQARNRYRVLTKVLSLPTLCALLLSVLISSCASNDAPGGKVPSQLERRSFQTREFDTPDTRLVMKATINVLQDMGFQIANADADLGLLTAEKWANIEHKKKAIKKARKEGRPLSKSIVLESTANVSTFGTKQTRVRVNFLERILDDTGATMAVNQIDDARFYQQFFASVDKGVFLQKEGV